MKTLLTNRKMDIRQKCVLTATSPHHLRKNQLEVIINNNSNNGRKKLWEVMDVSMALMVVMVPWVYAHPQTHQVPFTECVECSACQKNSPFKTDQRHKCQTQNQEDTEMSWLH